MLGVYADFCPRIVKLLWLVPGGKVCKQKLRVYHPLQTWVVGAAALVGDACHSMLPRQHLGQGAAQAIEDGIVLAVVLGKLADTKDLGRLLLVYKRLRKARTESLVAEAAASGRATQAVPDVAFRRIKEGSPNPDKWVDGKLTDYVYGFNCVADVEVRYEECFAEVVAC